MKELVIIVTLITLGSVTAKLIDEVPQRITEYLHQRDTSETNAANAKFAESLRSLQENSREL